MASDHLKVQGEAFERGRTSLEFWFPDGLLMAGLGWSGGHLRLRPFAVRNGQQHHDREREVRIPLTREDLKRLHDAIGEMLFWSERPQGLVVQHLEVTPTGKRASYREHPVPAAPDSGGPQESRFTAPAGQPGGRPLPTARTHVPHGDRFVDPEALRAVVREELARLGLKPAAATAP